MNKDIDISKVVLKTDRLILRIFYKENLDDFFEYACVDGVGQMAGWAPHKNKQESKKILEMFINDRNTFALVYDNKVIGSIGIHKYNEVKYPEFEKLACCEIGFVLSKDYWGKGLMSEAVKEVCCYLFEKEKFDQIICCHLLNNTRSKRVQEKCGFIYYKEIEHTTSMGTVEQTAMNILTYDRFRELKGE